MTTQTHNEVIIKDVPNKGRGVFASRNFKKGESVIIGKPIEIPESRTMTSFQVDWDKHVELDEPAVVINHSCDPSLGVRNNAYGGYTFHALREIKSGVELSWNYNTTEYISIAVSTCHCGANNCKGKTLGFKFLEDELRNLYGDYIADYLKEPKK
jgi:SET domain-containing protein